MEILDSNAELIRYLEDIRRAIELGLHRLILDSVVRKFEECEMLGHKVIFIGNGGSAAICSHMALDFTNAGGIKAICFNDSSLLTCLANDYGFENVFARAIGLYAVENDILVAISSSGLSEDILRGVQAARKLGCYIITLSGFGGDNPLLKMGDINIYLPIVHPDYGKVEVAHYLVLHFISDCLKKKKPA